MGMIADAARCEECGEPLSTERRLVSTVSGSWAVVTLPKNCTNPACPRSAEGKDTPGGVHSLVA